MVACRCPGTRSELRKSGCEIAAALGSIVAEASAGVGTETEKQPWQWCSAAIVFPDASVSVAADMATTPWPEGIRDIEVADAMQYAGEQVRHCQKHGHDPARSPQAIMSEHGCSDAHKATPFGALLNTPRLAKSTCNNITSFRAPHHLNGTQRCPRRLPPARIRWSSRRQAAS